MLLGLLYDDIVYLFAHKRLLQLLVLEASACLLINFKFVCSVLDSQAVYAVFGHRLVTAPARGAPSDKDCLSNPRAGRLDSEYSKQEEIRKRINACFCY